MEMENGNVGRGVEGCRVHRTWVRGQRSREEERGGACVDLRGELGGGERCVVRVGFSLVVCEGRCCESFT